MAYHHFAFYSVGLILLGGCSNGGESASNQAPTGGQSSSSPSSGSARGGSVGSSSESSRGGSPPSTGGASAQGGTSATPSNGGTTADSTRTTSIGGATQQGGSSTSSKGGSVNSGGAVQQGGASSAGTSSKGGASTTGGAVSGGGASVKGGAASGGNGTKGGATALGGTSAAGTTGTLTVGGASCSGPIGTFSGELATGIAFMDTEGNRVNAHGGGIIKEGDTYYLHGEYFLSTTTDNNFNGFSMYSSKDLATWKNEGIILPQQASGELGPNRKGERPHIIKCPATGEFVLYAHAADSTYQVDKEVVYATSATVNGKYTYQGPLTNASGTTAAHSDMSAFADGNDAYVLTESGHVYTLAQDCHSWLSDKAYSAVNGDSGGSESPTVFKAGSTYYWIGSYKTGWRANNNFYSTAPAMTGPWTYQGYIAPVDDASNEISDERTWLSQSTWVQPIQGCQGTTYLYWGDHWDGTQDTTAPGKHNYLATYVFQPLVFDGTKISMPVYLANWRLDVGAGTWSK